MSFLAVIYLRLLYGQIAYKTDCQYYLCGKVMHVTQTISLHWYYNIHILCIKYLFSQVLPLPAKCLVDLDTKYYAIKMTMQIWIVYKQLINFSV